MRKSTLERYWEEEEFKGFFHDLLAESGLERINEYVQHGSTTRLLHSLAVAYYSYRLARFTRLSFHWQELVRGALLHDYFLYDAQDGDPARKGHWTRHPHIAAENAKQEMDLTPIERIPSAATCSPSPSSRPNTGRAWWSLWWTKPARCMSSSGAASPIPNCAPRCPYGGL